MQTRAALLTQTNTPLQIETLDLEEPREGEVLIKVAAAGVCHSDWHLVTGDTQHPLPAVLGHEGAGKVVQVGEGVSRVKIGDHVALNWAPCCGTCFYCNIDRPNLCATYTEPIWAGTLRDGTPRLSWKGRPVYHYSALACFADYAVVPQESCVPMPKALPLSVAALIGCAVTTGMGSVFNTAKVEKGASVALYGAGGVGLSTLIAARFVGADPIIAVDRAPEKETLSKAAGATHFLCAGPNTVEEIRSLTHGRGADYVFDTTGLPKVQEECLHAARPGGSVILAGLAPMGSGTNFPGALITRQEKTVMGTYYGTADTFRDFPHFADLHLQGKIDLECMITQTYTLEEINPAFETMLTGEKGRGVILFE